MSAVARIGRVLRQRWGCLGIAAIAISACAAPDDSEGSSSDLSHASCDDARATFLSGGSDYAAVRSACGAEVDDYLKSQGKNFDWFKNNPLGLSGLPLGIMLAMMENHDIWPVTSEGMNTLGIGNNPEPDPKDHPRMGLPYGMVYEYNPTTRIRHVFFSCGGCHTGRVIGSDNKIQLIHGAPNTELDAQLFGWRVRLSMLGVPGKPGYATAEVDANGDYVFDEEGYPKFSLTDAGRDLKGKAIEKTKSLPGLFQGDLTESVIYVAKWDEIMKKLVASSVRTDTMYGSLPKKDGAYPGDARSPNHVGPRPGMMDAYGFASGLVYTHAQRDDFFAKVKNRFGADYARHPFFQGLTAPGQSDADLFAKARQRIRGNPAEWLPSDPAPVDVKSLFHLSERGHVGWDGNQATTARVIASGTSSVGDPWNVNLPVHEGMGEFVGGLPAAPYPFDVNRDLAKQGAALFGANCSGCHKKNNDQVYKLDTVGTDPNRANVVSPLARAGLVELMRQACEGTGNGRDIESNISIDSKKYSSDWCLPKGPKGETLSMKDQDDAFFRERAVKGNPNVGYKADELRGIWSQAPYLHNGSVPTLWHMLNPEERPAVFIRGNINYDKEKVGFAWTKADGAPKNYPAPHIAVYDAGLRGQTNTGHTFGSQLSVDEKKALIEYLKTL